MQNRFVTNPVKIVVYDPVRGRNLHTFVMLGDVPKYISDAVNSWNSSSKSSRATAGKTLRKFYGDDFMLKLGLSVRDPETAFLPSVERTADVDGAMDVRGGSDDPRIGAPDGLVEDADVTGGVSCRPNGTPLPKGMTDDIYCAYTQILGGDDDDARPYTEHDALADIRDAYGLDGEGEAVGGDNTVAGGADDDDFLADIEAQLAEPTEPTRETRAPKITPHGVAMEQITWAPGVEWVTDVHVYPEDKFSELKDKIYITTGIPTYRQHVFYTDRGRVTTLYNLRAEGFYSVDIRKISKYTDLVAGIPIDKTLYDLRDAVRVEAHDTFRILGDTLAVQNVVYVVDLEQFTGGIHAQLTEIAADTYQFELFYYGFIVKYWPQLTPECFHDYVRSEVDLQHKYPMLARPRPLLRQIYRVERDIIDANYRNWTKAQAWVESKNAPINMAITQMIAAVVTPRTIINTRNLFDRLRVTRCIPEIHAYVEHGGKKYLLRKRHIRNGSDIVFPSGVLMKTGVTIAVSLRKADQDAYHARRAATTMENEQTRYMFLNIWPNGRYHIRSLWNEEDELGFEDIIAVMKKYTRNIIAGINALGRHVFIAGSGLQQVSKSNLIFQSLNVSVMWKRVMLESTYRLVRSLWDNYTRAGITAPKPTQQHDRYEFVFRKGMHEFDPTSIERIVTASNNMILRNYYAYLSNSLVKQKWDQNYDGRLVAMTHRTTDVRFEISDVHRDEFDIFYHYAVMFIWRAVNDEKIRDAFVAVKSYKDVKKLRKLREQDPELYNLKKHESKKVYSIICQNPRQPLIYTPDEVRAMSPADLKKLTQYWNFTLNKPAWYGCPNKKYPHLSFMVNKHPRHYCLPCCNKKPQTTEDSKKTRINRICLTKHKYTLAEDIADKSASRHVINYGKDVDVGRLSRLPTANLKHLLFGTVAHPIGYYLLGVAQHVPSVQHVGAMYALAEALGLQPAAFLRAIITEVRKRSSFGTLLGGSISEHFRDVEDLAQTMAELFLEARTVTGGTHQNFHQWPELFIELASELYDVAVITFVDTAGDGARVTLYVDDSLRDEVVTGEPSAGRMILLLKKVNQYYPIFALDPDHYWRTLEVDTRAFPMEHPVARLLCGVVRYDARTDDMRVGRRIDLRVIERFAGTTGTPGVSDFASGDKSTNTSRPTNVSAGATHQTNWSIHTYYINRHNLCYAVDLARKDGASGSSTEDRVYVPIDYSSWHRVAGTRVSFEPFDRERENRPLSATVAILHELGEFINANYKVGTTMAGASILHYEVPTPEAIIVMRTASSMVPWAHQGSNAVAGDQGTPVAIRCSGTLWYFNRNDAPAPAGPNGQPLAREITPYDYTAINKAILLDQPPANDGRQSRLGPALYRNYLYQLFIIEFVNYLDHERNAEMREQLRRVITETNFRKDITAFRQFLHKLLSNYPSDYAFLLNQLMMFYYSHFDKQQLLSQIDTTVYDFDRATINRLKSMDGDTLRTELTKIAHQITVEGDLGSTFEFPNVYTPCNTGLNVLRSGGARARPANAQNDPGVAKMLSAAGDKLAATTHETVGAPYCQGRKLIISPRAIGHLGGHGVRESGSRVTYDEIIDTFVDLLASDLKNDIKSKYMLDNIWMDTIINYFAFTRHPSEIITIYRM